MEQLKKGYKKTEVGAIPEDWDVAKLNSISIPVRGVSPRPAGSPRFFNGNFIPWLTVTSLTNISDSQIFVNKTESFLTEEGSKQSRILNVGTLIIANSGATLGVAKLLSIRCCANDGVAALLNIDKNIDPKFLVYYINTLTDNLRNNIATGNGQPNLNTELIGNICFPLPPTLTEQKAIADALIDVDELITNLEKLIAKKKAIKQGAMQQLLTPPHKGGKRLDGFSGDWVEKNLGDCLKYEQPTKYIVKSTEYEEKSQVPVLTAGKSFLLGFTDENFGVYENLPVIIFDDFTTSSQFVNFKFKVKSSAMKMLTPTCQDFDINFIYALMNTISYSLGDEHKRRWIAEFSKIKIYVPQIKEQKAITQILNDIDGEITNLSKELKKRQSIKQGMMQELLTGKTRLI